ncbi:Panacea domain-containing protein [Acidovorax sp. Root402]|jgi:uncharacterized phage-associated protein|uniref:Panacea domain-containing protein n=1 Tax=Acidovorax sp. Root402 TaxID=1736527 RepID=UPI0009E79C44|nr:type II toxin-antitoxin system antitoxin SocA domain-containing protein [Acidovorax sp. Root402]
MAYSAYAVANAFVQRATGGYLRNLSPMKLQKLMFFAHAWYLKGRRVPLLDDSFARWTHGPVIPSIYHEFKAYGYRPIDKLATTLSLSPNGYAMNVPTVPPTDLDTWALIDAVIAKYGHLDGPALSALTHQPNSAWAAKPADGSPITADEILADPTIQ